MMRSKLKEQIIYALEFCKKNSGAVNSQVIIALLGPIIIIVILVILLPLIMDSTFTASSNAYIGNFPGTQALTNLIPLISAAGVLSIVGFIVISLAIKK